MGPSVSWPLDAGVSYDSSAQSTTGNYITIEAVLYQINLVHCVAIGAASRDVRLEECSFSDGQKVSPSGESGGSASMIMLYMINGWGLRGIWGVYLASPRPWWHSFF